jgi:hypothetical protein
LTVGPDKGEIPQNAVLNSSVKLALDAAAASLITIPLLQKTDLLGTWLEITPTESLLAFCAAHSRSDQKNQTELFF